MKDYSLFVNSAYIITFVITGIFGTLTVWQFRRNSKKLALLQKNQDDKSGKKKK
jgi:cytochrome oxidase assembly protein ShyY1